jgi:hypothetical protein
LRIDAGVGISDIVEAIAVDQSPIDERLFVSSLKGNTDGIDQDDYGQAMSIDSVWYYFRLSWKLIHYC